MTRYRSGLLPGVTNLFAGSDVPSASLRFMFCDTMKVLDGRGLDVTLENVRHTSAEMHTIEPRAI
jgi:hypothetical protein